MKRHIVMLAALAVAVVSAPSHADPVPFAGEPSPLALAVDAAAPAPVSFAPPSGASAQFTGTPALYSASPLTLDAVMYRPRSRYYNRGRGPMLGSEMQIHAGFFTPDGSSSSGFVLGMRGGPLVDPHIQLGASADWEHRSDESDQVIGTSSGPGGTTIQTKRQLSSSSENTFPILGFIQVKGDDRMSVVPYAGFGGGYEIVQLSATDFATNSSFDATYGGWGWQAWLGARIPLSGRSALLAEGFLNRCEAHRDVYDAVLNETFRETVDLNGYGMRFGLTWGI
jgi:hypothetical protein